MNFDEVLKGLRQDYLASLPQKISDIRQQIQSGGTSELRDCFHRLKGTGKTYGLPEVSELAATVETICLRVPRQSHRAATQALTILQDIYQARNANSQLALAHDQRFQQIMALLAN